MCVALLVALLSAVFYGTADFLGGLASRRAAALSATLVSQGIGLVLVALALPLFPAEPPSMIGGLWAVGAGATGGMGVALLYYGLAVGRVSVVAPVTAVCAITIPVLVAIGLGERPDPLALAGIVVAVASVALISRHDDPAGKPEGHDRSLAIALASGLWPLLIARAVSTVALAAIARLAKVPLVVPRAVLPVVVACGALDMLANALYLIAVREGPLGLVATLASLYPASTVLLARVVLGERLRPVQSIGLACAAAAIVMITSR